MWVMYTVPRIVYVPVLCSRKRERKRCWDLMGSLINGCFDSFNFHTCTNAHTHSHIQYTYKVIFRHPDSLQRYECAMLAASLFQLPSAPGSSSFLMVLDGVNTTAAEGKDFCSPTIMSHKAVITRCWEWLVYVRSRRVCSTKRPMKFGFCNTVWNVLLYNKYIKLGSVVNLQVQKCYFYIEMLFRRRHTCHCERASEAKVRGREKEK